MEIFELISLYDIYGELLTDKAKKIFKLHYLEDLSLREIGEMENITFQAVRSSIISTKNKLRDLEDKLKILQNKRKIEKLINILQEEKLANKEIYELIKEIK